MKMKEIRFLFLPIALFTGAVITFALWTFEQFGFRHPFSIVTSLGIIGYLFWIVNRLRSYKKWKVKP